MSRLLSRGYIAALAPQGLPNFDIVVTSVDGRQLCAFQVKTRWEKGGDHGWHMQEKHEHLSSPSIFYCFVDLRSFGDNSPTVHVIPSFLVAKLVKESHASWLSTPGAKGQKRNDSKFRRLLPDYRKLMGAECEYSLGWMDAYLENWDQIQNETAPTTKSELRIGGGFTPRQQTGKVG